MKSKERTDERFDDLILRIKTVEAVIGYRLLYHTPSGYNKKTVEKWLRKDAYPRRSSLQEFCHCAGMTLSAFKASRRELAGTLAGISEDLHRKGKLPRSFTEDDVLEVMDGFNGRCEPVSVFSETINAIGPKTMEKYVQKFRGCYIGYIFWSKWEQTETGSITLEGAPFRCLIRVDPPESGHQTIRARLTTFSHLQKYAGRPERRWAYEGVMIPIPGKLIFLMEAPNPSFEDMGVVFIMTQSTPKNCLLGILSSDSSVPDTSGMFVHPIPSAARIMLQKADETIPEDELAESLDHENPIAPEIIEMIQNEIHPKAGILMPRFDRTVM